MQLYNKLLDKYPLLTKSITSGIVFSAGDAITQTCTILFTQVLKTNHLVFRGISIFLLLELRILPPVCICGTARLCLELLQICSPMHQRHEELSIVCYSISYYSPRYFSQASTFSTEWSSNEVQKASKKDLPRPKRNYGRQ